MQAVCSSFKNFACTFVWLNRFFLLFLTANAKVQEKNQFYQTCASKVVKERGESVFSIFDGQF